MSWLSKEKQNYCPDLLKNLEEYRNFYKRSPRGRTLTFKSGRMGPKSLEIEDGLE